jgi:hypothetical protein
VSVRALQLTGGSDVAERFETASQLPAGSIVIIDDIHPGRLRGSDRAYDRRVAGIISGAGHVVPGLSLEELDSGRSRQQVALSGRVYAQAGTSNGPIRPGDFLTSSNKARHAMRVTDLKRAQGAIIGKAMSKLDGGEGYVLVLVSLQ